MVQMMGILEGLCWFLGINQRSANYLLKKKKSDYWDFRSMHIILLNFATA